METPAEATRDLVARLDGARNAARRRRSAIGVAIGLALAAATYAIRTHQTQPPPAIRYDTAQATRGPLTVKVTATGTLQPVTQVDVGTEVSGTVEKVFVDFNDRVEAGQILARLDATQLAAKERQSRAALELAEARVTDARATVTETARKLERADKLIERRLSSMEDHDTLRAARDRAAAGVTVALAQVNQARAQLDYDQRLLEKAVIHAPISGIVLKRQVEPGQTVVAALQTPVLFTLAENLTQMELHVQVDEADVGQVASGQPAEFIVDAYPNIRFPAVITLVRFVPQTVDNVVTYETLLTVDNSALLLRPGMTVTAEITVKHSADVLRVPNAALRFVPPTREPASNDSNSSLVGRLMWRPPPVAKRDVADTTQGARVWVLRDGQPLALAVKTGATDRTQTEITDGELTAGSVVLIDSHGPPES
ncbi:MAG: efflux RND transporter periplasmic adaptor subunit [Gammaproteobacteria bacterium]|nr:efflux RND transporter periplasmic adaptor subunit [Gammaproteobacteria bacterium]